MKNLIASIVLLLSAAVAFAQVGQAVMTTGNQTISGTKNFTGTLQVGGTSVSTLFQSTLTDSAGLRGALSDETGTGLAVFATSPTLTTPLLGTPTSGTLTNCTGLPIATGVSGLGADVATFLATPSSANLATAVTGETGSGALVFGTSPSLTTPNIGAATATSVNGIAVNATTTRPYTSYVALLTQSGTDAPTATVLENTLGGSVVWARSDVGVYTGTLVGAFTLNKTAIFTSPSVTDSLVFSARTSADVVTLTTSDVDGTILDALLLATPIEIRVFP